MACLLYTSCFPRADCDGRRGLLAYQKRDYTGGRSPRNPVDKWIIALGRHPEMCIRDSLHCMHLLTVGLLKETFSQG